MCESSMDTSISLILTQLVAVELDLHAVHVTVCCMLFSYEILTTFVSLNRQ